MRADAPAMRLIPAQAGWLAAEAVASGLVMGAAVSACLLGQRFLLSEDGVRLTVALTSGFGLAFVLLACAHRVHANPLLSLTLRSTDQPAGGSAPPPALRAAAQCTGACAGLITAQSVFNLDAVQAMSPAGDLWASAAGEIIASVSLPVAYLASGARRIRAGLAAGATLAAVCALGPAYAFGNPAATVARSLCAGPLGLAVTEAALILLLQIAAGALTIWAFTRNKR